MLIDVFIWEHGENLNKYFDLEKSEPFYLFSS